MIKVTIELLPHGNEKQKKHLGTIEISNRSGDRRSGNYVYTVSEEDDPNTVLTMGTILAFPRKLHVTHLVRRVLEEIQDEIK